MKSREKNKDLAIRAFQLREQESNLRSSGYEPEVNANSSRDIKGV